MTIFHCREFLATLGIPGASTFEAGLWLSEHLQELLRERVDPSPAALLRHYLHRGAELLPDRPLEGELDRVWWLGREAPEHVRYRWEAGGKEDYGERRRRWLAKS